MLISGRQSQLIGVSNYGELQLHTGERETQALRLVCCPFHINIKPLFGRIRFEYWWLIDLPNTNCTREVSTDRSEKTELVCWLYLQRTLDQLSQMTLRNQICEERRKVTSRATALTPLQIVFEPLSKYWSTWHRPIARIDAKGDETVCLFDEMPNDEVV